MRRRRRRRRKRERRRLVPSEELPEEDDETSGGDQRQDPQHEDQVAVFLDGHVAEDGAEGAAERRPRAEEPHLEARGVLGAHLLAEERVDDGVGHLAEDDGEAPPDDHVPQPVGGVGEQHAREDRAEEARDEEGAVGDAEAGAEEADEERGEDAEEDDGHHEQRDGGLAEVEGVGEDGVERQRVGADAQLDQEGARAEE